MLKNDGFDNLLERHNIAQLVTICDNIQHIVDVRVFVSLFEKLRDTSALRQALDLMFKGFNLFKKTLPADDERTLQVEGLMYQAMINMGKYSEAVAGLDVLYAKLTSILGPSATLTLEVGNDFARALYFSGNLDQALLLGSEVYIAREKLLGPRDKCTLYSLTNLAVFLSCGQRGWKEFRTAGAIHETIYNIRRTDLGEKHKSTLNSRHHMAYCKLQDALEIRHYNEETESERSKLLTEAKYEFQQISTLRSDLLGPDNTETLRTQHWLSFANLKNGAEKEEVLLGLLEVLRKRSEILGEGHVETIATKELIDKVEKLKADEIDCGFEIIDP